jgi:hypothetical protein
LGFICICFSYYVYFYEYILKNKDILDGELIWKYVTLDRPKMREIGLAIGADPDALVTTIKELDQAVSFF